MFKYPENIIVNWLRSKMQGKIDKLEKETKNYLDYENNILILPSGVGTTIEIEFTSKTSFESSTTSEAVSSFILVKVGNIADFIGKKIIFISDFTSDNAYGEPKFISCDENGENRIQIGKYYHTNNNNTSWTMEIAEIRDTDIIEGNNILALRLYLNRALNLENNLSLSNGLIKIID